MRTLYKSSSRIAAAIVSIMVLSTSAAIALTRHDPQSMIADSSRATAQSHANPQADLTVVEHVDSLGRFVVTPRAVHFEPAPASMGRFVVSPNRTVFVISDATNSGA